MDQHTIKEREAYQCTYYWNLWQEAVLLGRKVMALPRFITTLEADQVYYSETSKYDETNSSFIISFTFYDPDKAQEFIDMLHYLPDCHFALDPKIKHSHGETFKRTGVLSWHDIEVDINISGLPKPPDCVLTKHTSTHTMEYYTAECGLNNATS